MFTGSLVALVTPMLANDAIDWDALSDLVEWHIQEKTDAIVAMGTTGESATLDVFEHAKVIEYIINVANKRIAVIAGTGANSTKEAIELTQKSKNLGADACLLVSPYYNKPTQEGIYLHYKAIADAVAIPQILYNVPGRTSSDIAVETTARLSQISNIIGTKEATGEVARVSRLKDLCRDDFMLYSGDDATAVDFIAEGGHGNISVTANIAPAQMAQMCQLALQGDIAGAQAINASIAVLHEILFCESNPIPVKWALHELGKIDAGIRLPLTPLAADLREPLKAALQQTGLLS